jgi:hypothetical protein
VSVLAGVRKTRYVTDAEEAVARPALLMAASLLAALYDELEFHKNEPALPTESSQASFSRT